MIGNFWAFLFKPHPYVKTALATFWATFVKLGFFFLQHLVTLFQPFLTFLIAEVQCDQMLSLKVA